MGALPGADLESHRQPRLTVAARPVLIEVDEDGAHVVERDHGGIGVAPVEDHLHLSSLLAQHVRTEPRTDVQHQQGIAIVDQGRHLGIAVDTPDDVEVARTFETGN